MNRLMATKMTYPVVAIALVIVVYLLYKKNTGQEKVSEFGKYQGYSEAIYDGTKRISDYLTLSNGTRLAYDLIVPTKKGVPARKPLPVLFKYTPYLRTFTIFDRAGKNIMADLFNLGWKERAFLRVRYWLDKHGNLMDPVFRNRYLKKMLIIERQESPILSPNPNHSITVKLLLIGYYFWRLLSRSGRKTLAFRRRLPSFSDFPS